MQAVQLDLNVEKWEEGVAFYTTLFGKPPDKILDYGVAEWELVPGCNLHVIGNPAEPLRLRLRVESLNEVYQRVKTGLGLEPSGDLWKYGTRAFSYSDPWGNSVMFESETSWSYSKSQTQKV